MPLPSLVHLWDTELALLQSQNRELVIYSHRLSWLVIVFWPTVNGVRLKATEVVRLVKEEKLHWPCFCSRLEDRSLACRIFILAGTVSAYCHYAPDARCQFFVPLHEIYETAELTFEYPTPVLHHPPYSKDRFLLARELQLFEPQQPIGHLGDHHEDIRQGSKVPLLLISDLVDRPETYHCMCQLLFELSRAMIYIAAAVAKKAYADAAVQTDLEVDDPNVVDATDEESRIVRKVFTGQLLKNIEVIALLRRCETCRKVFLSQLLGRHVCRT
ncbi:hypothetical protein R3P38DRAFT_2948372 [Favolaschia claudopus]|uniref:Uncharacterized protein n=1 Tax=Favolaschia claudopus TaxID=2862362 RepID=A0AAW0BJU3_9AGAR